MIAHPSNGQPEISTLLVEDCPEDAQLIRRHLDEARPAGFRVEWCGCLADALKRLASQSAPEFDAVLLDASLPDGTGQESLDKLRELGVRIPVIVLTDSEDDPFCNSAVGAGAQDYLVKPDASSRGLARAIRHAIERTQASEALQQSEERFRELTDLLPETVFEIDSQATITFANRRALDDFGYTVAELEAGLPAAQVIAPHDRDRLRLDIDRILAGEEPGGLEYTAMRKSGACFPVLIYASQIVRDGVATGIRGIAIDITARKRTEEQMRGQQAYLRNLVDSSLDMIIAVDNSRTIVEFNRAAERTFGYSRDEVVGRSAEMLYADSSSSADVVSHITEHGQYIGEITNRRKNGKTFPAFLSASVLHDAAGEAAGIMGISRDITESKQTQEALVESREYLENLVESSLDMIIATDVTRRIVQINHAAQTTLGYTREELLNSHVDMLYADPAESHSVHTTIEENGQFIGEITNRRKSGKTFPVLLSASILRDADGNYAGVMGISRDITAEKRAERELQDHRERLETEVAKRTAELTQVNTQLRRQIVERKEAEEARQAAERELEEQRVLSMRTDRLRSLGEMAAGIAHELNQPLSGVRGLAEHMLVGLDRGWIASEERLREKLELIVEQADRMTHIIQHVRMFAREAGKPELQPVNVNDVVKSCIDMVGQQFRDHGLVLETDLTGDIPAVSANPFSLEEIVLNLMTNARDALEDAPDASRDAPARVALRTRCQGTGDERRLIIEVSDSGPGIPAKHLPRVFDPFFTTKGPDKGTGLGLAICKAIVGDFGGAIEVHAEEGEGTTVTVSLPPAEAGS